MDPLTKFYIFLGALILISMIILIASRESNKYICPKCGANIKYIEELLNEDINTGQGYHGDEYRYTCPHCGHSHTSTITKWMYGN